MYTPPADDLETPPAPENPEPTTNTAPAPEGQQQQQSAAPASTKAIQQLTGKLGQQIRDTPELDSSGIKAVLNSIIAAVDLSKIEPSDLTDIQSKLNASTSSDSGDDFNAEEPAPEPAAEEPMSEDIEANYSTSDMEPDSEERLDYDYDDDMSSTRKFIANPFVNSVIRRAGLNNNINDDLVFDIAEAFYVYIIEQNSNSTFIQNLAKILKDNQFKARPGLHTYEDLEENGTLIYNTLHNMEEESYNQKPNPLSNSGTLFSLNEAQKKLLFSKLYK